MVTHGLLLIGGKTVRTPSYQVRRDEVISLKEGATKSPLVTAAEQRIKKYEPPQWLRIDKVKRTGSVLRTPEEGDLEIIFDASKIKEFYSR